MALLFSAISGHDPHDSTSLNIVPKNYVESLGKSEKKFRVGVPKEAFQAGLEKDVAEAFKSSLDTMRKLGWKVEEISLKHLDYSIAAYYIVATAEASSNLARYDGVEYGYRTANYHTLAEMYEKSRGEGFGPEVKRRIMLGTYVLSAGYYEAYYGKGQKVRTLIKRDFVEAFKNFDVIVMPTSPTVAFGLGEKIEDPLAMYLSDIFTTVANFTFGPICFLNCKILEIRFFLFISTHTFGFGILVYFFSIVTSIAICTILLAAYIPKQKPARFVGLDPRFFSDPNFPFHVP